MSASLVEVRTWLGRTLRDTEGEKLGTIDHAYMDRDTEAPSFVAIKTGLLGRRSSLAPVDGIRPDGDGLVAPFSKSTLKDAPSVDHDGELAVEDEDRLYTHYERREQYTQTNASPERLDTRDDESTTPDAEDGQMMTRSEEELQVSTEQRVTGRARLRKVIITEDVQVTIPVRREEVRVEYDDVDAEPPA